MPERRLACLSVPDHSELQGGFELGTCMCGPVYGVTFTSKVVFRIIAQQVPKLERSLVILNDAKRPQHGHQGRAHHSVYYLLSGFSSSLVELNVCKAAPTMSSK